MTYTFRRIERWPKEPTRTRRRAPFKAGYAATLTLLERELTHLKAQGVVIQTHMAANDIRNDGLPRSSARPSAPGVIVTFLAKGKPFSFPCDTYVDWEDNLRAVALSLEALRAVDRYGVTRGGEQYQGFKALPAPADAQSAFESAEAAASFLAQHSREFAPPILTDPARRDAAYRDAAKRLHPDRGGSPEDWHKLQEALRVLQQERSTR